MLTVLSVLKLKTEKGVCTDSVLVSAHCSFLIFVSWRCIIRLCFLFCLHTVSESLDELVSTVAYRLGTDGEKSSINLLVRCGFLYWKHTHVNWTRCRSSKFITQFVGNALTWIVLHAQQYDDDEGDRVLLTSDSDLTAAIQHAKSAGWKVIIFLFGPLDYQNALPPMQSRYSEFAFLSQVLRLHMDDSQVMTESTVPRANTSTSQRARTSLRFGIVACAVALAGVAVIVYLKRSQLWSAPQFKCSHHTVQITLIHHKVKHSRLYTYLEIHKSHDKIRHGLFFPLCHHAKAVQ